MTRHQSAARWRLALALLAWLLTFSATGWPVAPAVAQDQRPVDFEKNIAPLLLARCLECHSQQDPAGKLNLTSAAGLAQGGESGAAVKSGEPDKSLLLKRVLAGEMPPPKQGQPRTLAAGEQELLRRWIATGAAWPQGRVLDPYERTSDVRGGRDWWSFQPLNLAAVPAAQSPGARERLLNPIDAFIQQRLQAESLTLAPPAERRVLLRRLTHDLLGLPADAETLDEFVADDGVDAYERQVDRLLASPAFGERWARYWLDLARYADTCGYERDQDKPHAWRYRDWVVAAINQDLPYDEFVRQQMAGDELAQRTEASVIATGFLRLGTWNDEPNDPLEYQYERLEDLVHVVSTAFLGVTVKCARCHDHKFDPIPQSDYYRMAAAFWAGPIAARGRELLGGPTKEELGFDVLGWTDLTAKPAPLRLLRKGDPLHPQAEVAPGHLTLLPSLNRPVVPAGEGARTSERRRQLADWIVDRGNPITPRVAVNRLWLHHFGQGLVRSPNNFGFQGERPTHPELLDYLAQQLHEGNWHGKPLHRLLVTSAVYRQSSTHPRQQAYEDRDYTNRWWWRSERRRLDAETLRDAILVSAGQLDQRLGGPSFKPTISAEALEGLSRKSAAWTASAPREQLRRALYIYSQRSLLSPLLTTFDFADTTLPCGQRDVSTVAPQALALLNNPFIHEQSLQLARRLQAEDARPLDDPAAISTRIGRLWRMTLGRVPSERERQVSREFLEEQMLQTIPGARALAQRKPQIPASREELDQSLGQLPGLVLHLAAERGVKLDADRRVERWDDSSAGRHHASQLRANCRPEFVADAGDGRPTLRFDGQRQFLQLEGQVLAAQQFSLFAVVTDRGPPGHRELFSNWNGAAGNSTSSLFVGMTNRAALRVSDDFSGVGEIKDPAKLFLLNAIATANDVVLWQNGHERARKERPLSPRLLTTPYVIGQQGNIQGEYWHGELRELLVFGRDLKEQERHRVSQLLGGWYRLPYVEPVRSAFLEPQLQAWAALAQVLLNSNEFIYID